jgi:glycosyltransferase involved in cell wall biosynthesis
MKQKLRDNRVYIYTGTQPASYTLNFMESLMTGIPVVALGSQHATSLGIAGQVYEVDKIIQNGVNGFVSDDIGYLREKILWLLDNPQAAKQIGEMGRETAIKYFGKETIKQLWKETLDRLTTNT